jgi:MFS family permease
MKPAPDIGSTQHMPSLRHNRNFRWMWLGQAVSVLGDEILDTSVILWLAVTAVGSQSWGPAAVAGALAARMAPILMFGLLGGVFTDRWDCRRTMLTMDVIRGVLIGGLAVLLLVGTSLPIAVQLTSIYAVLTLCALATVFFNPARYCVLAAVVADSDRERMGSITAGTTALAAIVGPALAAAMLVLADVQWALVVTAAGFVVSFISVAKVRVPEGSSATANSGAVTTGMWRELVIGLRFFASNPMLRVVLVVTAITVAGVTTINTLGVFFVTQNLHSPAQTYGLLGTAFGIGSLIGAGLSAVFAGRFRAERVYVYSFAVAGLLLIGYSRATVAEWAILLLFLTGVPVAAVNSMMGPLLMRTTPPHFLGRVTGVLLLATRLTGLVSVTVAAWLATTVLRGLDAHVAGIRFGTIDTILMGVGVITAMTGLWAARSLKSGTDAAGPTMSGPDDQVAGLQTAPPRQPAGIRRFRRRQSALRAPRRRRPRSPSRSDVPTP